MDSTGATAPGAAHVLDNWALALLTVACAASVANAYYIQPLLVEIGAALNLSERLVGLLPAMTQIGVALGVLGLLPLADIMSARRLLLAIIPVQVAALLLASVSNTVGLLAPACLFIGLAGITPYILPPYVSSRLRPGELGRVTGLLTRGVIVGILLARTVSGFIGIYLGWRAVYVVAAVVMLGVLASLSRIVRPAPDNFRASVSYRATLLSMVGIVRSLPALRVGAVCQALGFGSFNVFWLGMVFYLQSPAFGWSPDMIGLVAVVGAIAASAAPYLGKAAERAGPAKARAIAFAGMVGGWIILALCRNSLAGMAIGLVVLDLGATVSDIMGRTILYSLDVAIRSRLNAIYTVAMFTGGALMSALVGPFWSGGGWLCVCGLGLSAALLALVMAWRDAHRG